MKGLIIKGTYVKNEKEDDKLRLAGGAWTINLDEVDLLKVETVRYITDKNTYTISSEEALKRGFGRVFNGETKLVVPIKFWKIKEIEGEIIGE